MDQSIPPFDSSDNVCKKICRFNQLQTHCIGCKRTPKEIINWHTYSMSKQKYIKDSLKSRKIILEDK